MVKRLVVGLVIGLFVGALVAAALIKGLGITSFDGATGTALSYLFAAATGMLTGLVAGKPIWSSGGKIEASLKAFFGALLAAGGMFALQHWVTAQVNLEALGAGEGLLGTLPAAALPIVGAVLGMIFEVDNTDSGEAKASGKRVAEMRPVPAGASKTKTKARGTSEEEEEEDEVVVPGRKARR